MTAIKKLKQSFALIAKGLPYIFNIEWNIKTRINTYIKS